MWKLLVNAWRINKKSYTKKNEKKWNTKRESTDFAVSEVFTGKSGIGILS